MLVMFSQIVGNEVAMAEEKEKSARPTNIVHRGGCHCGQIRYEVLAPASLECIECNCSICRKKQNIHFIIPETHFTLLQGEDNLACYTFNTNKARHFFCKTCGVQSFYKPRSNQNGYGIMPHCLDQETIQKITILKFDGNNWEDSLLQQGETIQNMSKV